jgi:hypothetical protein
MEALSSSETLVLTRATRRNISEVVILHIYILCILCTVFIRSVRRLLVTSNVVPSSPILVTLMMDLPDGKIKKIVFHPVEGGAKFLRNVGPYKSHAA